MRSLYIDTLTIRIWSGINIVLPIENLTLKSITLAIFLYYSIIDIQSANCYSVNFLLLTQFAYLFGPLSEVIANKVRGRSSSIKYCNLFIYANMSMNVVSILVRFWNKKRVTDFEKSYKYVLLIVKKIQFEFSISPLKVKRADLEWIMISFFDL